MGQDQNGGSKVADFWKWTRTFEKTMIIHGYKYENVATLTYFDKFELKIVEILMFHDFVPPLSWAVASPGIAKTSTIFELKKECSRLFFVPRTNNAHENHNSATKSSDVATVPGEVAAGGGFSQDISAPSSRIGFIFCMHAQISKHFD